ncbi:hypothetical protein ACFV1W_34670 [Kitasatospora sp. NPDC059648]|uniref:hypothetical protein n=1 Tax=Kitasatospora sp. NPDC059648 TaxID=3346894 RepID=UPI0036BAE701
MPSPELTLSRAIAWTSSADRGLGNPNYDDSIGDDLVHLTGTGIPDAQALEQRGRPATDVVNGELLLSANPPLTLLRLAPAGVSAQQGDGRGCVHWRGWAARLGA